MDRLVRSGAGTLGLGDKGLTPSPTEGPTRFPTVVVGSWALGRGVHLRSWAAGCRCGDDSGSRLNGRERG